MTNRKLHTSFWLVPKSTTLDDLERPIRTLLQKRCVFRSPDRLILSTKKCRWLTLISGDIRFMRIFAEVPRGGGVKRQWGCQQQQFSAFSGDISSEILEMRPALLYSNTQSIICFSLIPRCVTLNDLDWLFHIKFCFFLHRFGFFRPHNFRKITVCKLIKIDTYCQQHKSLAGTLVSDDIRFLLIFGRVL